MKVVETIKRHFMFSKVFFFESHAVNEICVKIL